MYVTSDIFELDRVTTEEGFEWRENLVGGVAAHGSRWPSARAAAKFLTEASRMSSLESVMQYAGYGIIGKSKTNSISVSSLDKIINSNLPNADGAISVILTGQIDAEGSQSGSVLFGGEVSGSSRADYNRKYKDFVGVDDRPFSLYFLFPVSSNYVELSGNLLSLASQILGCEYGYSYVRDEFCLPAGYDVGVAPAFDDGEVSDNEAAELQRWSEIARAEYWKKPMPFMRDLYEVNLLSDKHANYEIDGMGRLSEWISASEGRGQLEVVPGNRILWKLNEAEIVNIRPDLRDAGVLYQCPDRVYRDLQAPKVRRGLR